jgi:hypothetical protein
MFDAFTLLCLEPSRLALKGCGRLRGRAGRANLVGSRGRGGPSSPFEPQCETRAPGWPSSLPATNVPPVSTRRPSPAGLWCGPRWPLRVGCARRSNADLCDLVCETRIDRHSCSSQPMSASPVVIALPGSSLRSSASTVLTHGSPGLFGIRGLSRTRGKGTRQADGLPGATDCGRG